MGVSRVKDEPTPRSSPGDHIGGLGKTTDEYDSSTSSEVETEVLGRSQVRGTKFVHVCTPGLSYAFLRVAYSPTGIKTMQSEKPDS